MKQCGVTVEDLMLGRMPNAEPTSAEVERDAAAARADKLAAFIRELMKDDGALGIRAVPVGVVPPFSQEPACQCRSCGKRGHTPDSVQCASSCDRPRAAGREAMSDDAVLELIAAYGRALTKRQLEVLRMMADAEDREEFDGAELVYDRGTGYVGLERIGGRTLVALIKACAISQSSINGGTEVWTINETGRQLIERP
jgi:hypothetical protein